MSKRSFLSALALGATVLALVVGLAPARLGASSHREAPLISKDAFADNTDTYVFIPAGQTDNIVLVAGWIPFEGPEGGPNYWEWEDGVLYDIYVDNDGDALADFTYTLTSASELGNPDTFLYNTGPIDSLDDADWNSKQRYTVTETSDAGTTVLVDNELAPPSNIGSKSTPDYAALMEAGIYTYDPDGFPDTGDEIKIFGGQTDDPFFVDLQVFDLLTLRGQDPPVGYDGSGNRPVDSLSGFNVHNLILEIPIDRLVDADPVLGVWSATRRPTMGVLEGEAQTDFVQVSRLGMPLVNEVVLPLGLKDTFNAISPDVDLTVYGLLQESVEDPEVGNLLCALYGVPLPDDSDDDCDSEFTPGVPSTGRSDIFQIFVTGMVLVNPFTINTAGGPVELPAGFNVNQPAGVVPAEMIRINTAISGDLCSPEPSRLGILGADACGFPNGRRLTDDIVEIELLAVAGAAHQVLDGTDPGFVFDPALIDVLTDRVDRNDQTFHDTFPYVAAAQSGQKHFHQNQRGPRLAAQGESALIFGLVMVGALAYVQRRRAN